MFEVADVACEEVMVNDILVSTSRSSSQVGMYSPVVVVAVAVDTPSFRFQPDSFHRPDSAQLESSSRLVGTFSSYPVADVRYCGRRLARMGAK